MDEHWPNPRFYRWVGVSYGTGTSLEPTECPEDGTTAYMGSDWQETTEDDADVVEVPYTVWGDYVGSSVERSNYRSLLRDYPDVFIDISGGYWSHVLYIRPRTMLQTDGLFESITALFDYPLYDEEDHSELEMTEAWEAWDGWVKFDLGRALATEYDLDVDNWTEEEWDFIKQRFYAISGDENGYPYMEDATNVVFPHFEETTETLANEIATLGFANDPRRPNPNQLTLEEGE